MTTVNTYAQLEYAAREARERLRIMREHETLRVTGLSRTTRYRREKQGRFPKRIALGPTASGYFAAEIYEWLLEQLRERDRERE